MTDILTANQIRYLAKYSYIEKTEARGAYMLLYYRKDGVLKHKRIARRASIELIKKLMQNIEKEVGVSKYGRGQKGKLLIA